MFDDLDDPSYAGPRPGAAEAVAARAARIRRNRRIGYASGAMSFVLVLAGTVTALRAARPQGTSAVQPVGGVTGSPTAQESPTPTASPSPSPTATIPPTAAPPTEPAPPPVTATTAPARQPRKDYVGQWLDWNALDWCRPATALPPNPGGLDATGLTMTVDLPDTVSAVEQPPVGVTFTNTTARTIWFSYAGAGGGPVNVVARSGKTFTGELHKERIRPGYVGSGDLTLAPGESETFWIPLVLDTCAPERSQDRRGTPALAPPGTYEASFGLMILERRDWDPALPPSPSPSPSATARGEVYSTVPQAVTVT